ncbi:hypothetical protein DFA_04326 [Cavenderia fasciculata]|uniref:Short-chain dehydrogenase/reductase family protein n=1 Tax=Cavenderia fasciculata TaxID=261658 RepID=F4PP95_CACFS|nr:uncharacterized protein DFA_04326 [Cavenderia fasciculata]EGG22208.1 hypothetical protein DFA_04326 [Cavenderia fasciculata]|eukprot:XP_004360059.1 hypothetical protein DFA_04326 [Cavenderia fasciculata]
MTDSSSRVLFIVGASTGFGLSMVKVFLEQGFRVAATSRSKQQLVNAVGETDTNKFIALENNLKEDEAINNTIQDVISHFGRIDIVFCNAGYGMSGTTEEVSDQNLRDMFDINFFSYASVLRHVTKYLSSGAHVFLLSSSSGFSTFPCGIAYNTSKFAVCALGESYAAEVKAFGIKVTNLNSGAFTTSFASGMKQPELNLRQKYKDIHDQCRAMVKALPFKDTTKFAELVLELVNSDKPTAPINLFVGADANEMAHEKIAQLQKDLKDNEEFTINRFLTN